MVKQEEKLGFTNKEALEFMFENTVLYWYYALNKQFTDDEKPKMGNNFSKNDKIFSNRVYRRN
jgi:hypothetical protein